MAVPSTGLTPPYGRHGLSFLNSKVLNPFTLPGGAQYYYPMNQSARFLWYHDHAYGITRLNAYAGLATGCLIRDTFEHGLIERGLPDYIEAGGNEIPLVIQDKIFVGPDIARAPHVGTGRAVDRINSSGQSNWRRKLPEDCLIRFGVRG
jgi:FtsP/CotA-like multicopper oxidase with cupredoxin domain